MSTRRTAIIYLTDYYFHLCRSKEYNRVGAYQDRTSNWVSTVGPIAQLDRAADSYLLVGSSILSGAATCYYFAGEGKPS